MSQARTSPMMSLERMISVADIHERSSKTKSTFSGIPKNLGRKRVEDYSIYSRIPNEKLNTLV